MSKAKPAMSSAVPGGYQPGMLMREKGIFLLSSEFSSESAERVVTWILEANLQKGDRPDHLTLIINSPGGDVNAGFAIIDTMRGSAIPVHTVGLGLIASCGLITFIAGEPGHRVLTPNTSILSHQWSWGTGFSKEHELFATVKEFQLTSKRMIGHYKKCTGLTEKAIRQKLLPPQDVWLSAKEAKKLNICDSIKIMK